MADDAFLDSGEVKAALAILTAEVTGRQSYVTLEAALRVARVVVEHYDELHQRVAGLREEVAQTQAALATLKREVVAEADAAQADHEKALAHYREQEREAQTLRTESEATLTALYVQMDLVKSSLAQAKQEAAQEVERTVAETHTRLEGETHRLERVKARLQAENAGLHQQQEDLRAGIAALQQRFAAAQEQMPVVLDEDRL